MFRPIFYRQGDGQGGGGTAAPAATPAAPSPTPSPPAALDPLAYNAEGVLYRDLLAGTEGGTKSLKTQHVAALATIQGQVDAHLATVQERDATITSLQTAAQSQVDAMAGLTEQAATIPDLVQRASYADKLEILMQFPQLVASQSPQEVPGVDGAEPTTVNINPYLELIATTTLTGDALRKQLTQLSGALPEPTQAAPTSALPVIPPPPEPATPDTRSSKLAEIGERLRLEPHNPAIQKEWHDALALPKALGGT